MYSLELTCCAADLDLLSAELWEAGTVGIRELERPDGVFTIIAGFDEKPPAALLVAVSDHNPRCYAEEPIDWEERTRQAWPARPAGSKLFLAPQWSSTPTPPGRIRIVHTPGLACGTGDHPCTQLALRALEHVITVDSDVADIGTGSGLLASAAALLGARRVAAVDIDEDALKVALSDFTLNGISPLAAVASADALRSAAFNVIVANISSTVVLFLLDELIRISTPAATIILTGFSTDEAARLSAFFPICTLEHWEEWACLIARLDPATQAP